MTKEVLIRISGLHMMEQDSDQVEMIITGEYYWKNGKHYLIYDEMMEGFDEKVHNLVKIAPDMMEIRKQGVASADMVFEQGKKRTARYVTPMGEMVIEIGTRQIQVDTQEDHLKVSVDYGLDINYDHVSDCTISVDVCSLDKAQLTL